MFAQGAKVSKHTVNVSDDKIFYDEVSLNFLYRVLQGYSILISSCTCLVSLGFATLKNRDNAMYAQGARVSSANVTVSNVLRL
jgi:hypothetical protein